MHEEIEESKGPALLTSHLTPLTIYTHKNIMIKDIFYTIYNAYSDEEESKHGDTL